MRSNHFKMFAYFTFNGLDLLELHCTLTIEAQLKSNMYFNNRYSELLNAYTIKYIILN